MSNFFNENPHPLVEDHYHIQELITAQDKRAKDRASWKELKSNEDGFRKWCDGFKDIELMNFYCSTCSKDFTARAKKQIDSWDDIAYYKIKHRCGTWSIRNITQRELDSYFYKSKQIAEDRFKNSNDMLQPFETGYNMVYGK